ncbi:hypothetical protein SDC9_162698 [bioreactor metagenome]|uniref:Uncharacterized protein n=1 Tax=bioreactor metagenome TaxID=1076179 RepID=A0A645FLT0_9ZZZZ
MVSAAQVNPRKLRQIAAEPRLHRRQGLQQGVGVLLAQGVKMQTGNPLGQPLGKLLRRHAQPGAGGAGVVDAMGLGGVHGVYADAHLSARRQGGGREARILGHGVKNHMVADGQKRLHLLGGVGSGKHMGLAPHVFIPQPRLKQAAGRCSA